MNEFLTQKYLAMKPYDFHNISEAPNLEESRDIVVFLNKTFGNKWIYDIQGTFNKVENGQVLETEYIINLYIPGFVVSGVGHTRLRAICNAVRDLRHSSESLIPLLNETEKSTESTIIDDSIKNIETPEQFDGVWDHILNNESNSNIEKSDISKEEKPLASTTDSITTIENITEEEQETPELVEFGSPESEAFEKEFAEQVFNKAPELPTPEMVNPNMQRFDGMWSPDIGTKFMQYAREKLGANSAQEVSPWTRRYCGLDFEYFNPQWTDKFIEWAEYVRERQTY